MRLKPNLLGLDPKSLAGLMDFYEVTMADANIFNGNGGQKSVFNAAVRGLREHKLVYESELTSDGNTIVIDGQRIGLAEYHEELKGKKYHLEEFEKDNYLLNLGLEQILGFLSGWEMNQELLELFRFKGLSEQTIENLQGAKLDVSIDAIPEGIPIFGNEPFVSLEGSFEHDQFPESLILGTWGYATAVGTNASYIVNMLEEFGRSNVVTLEGGSRRVYPGAALMASRAALAAGFKGTSLTQVGVAYPELKNTIGGSSGHSQVLHIGSDYAAFEHQLRAYYRIVPSDSWEIIQQKIAATKGKGPTFLIDTFGSNEGLKAAIAVMSKYGIQSQVRNDSGDPNERLTYIRKQLDIIRPDAWSMVSDDLKGWKIYELLKAGIPFDTLLIGTFLNNPRYLPGPVLKIAADEDSQGRLLPKCKICVDNVSKSTLPGQLDVYRVIGSDGYARKDVILMRDVDTIDRFLERSDSGYIKLNQRVMEHREIVYELPSMPKIIETTKYHMSLLKPEHKRFRGAASYEVEISDTINQEKEMLKERFVQGRL